MSYTLPVSIYKQDLEPEYLERCHEEHDRVRNKLGELLEEPMLYQEMLKYYQVKPNIVSFFGTMFRPEHIQYMPKFTAAKSGFNRRPDDIRPNEIHEIPTVCNSDVFLFTQQYNEIMMMSPDGAYIKTAKTYYSDVDYGRSLRYTFHNRYIFTEIPLRYSSTRNFTFLGWCFNQESLFRMCIRCKDIQGQRNVTNAEIYFSYVFSDSQNITIPELYLDRNNQDCKFIQGSEVELCKITKLPYDLILMCTKSVPIFDTSRNLRFVFLELKIACTHAWKLLQAHSNTPSTEFVSEENLLDDIRAPAVDTSETFDICAWHSTDPQVVRVAIARTNMSIDVFDFDQATGVFCLKETIYTQYLINQLGKTFCITFIQHDELAILVNGILYRHYL